MNEVDLRILEGGYSVQFLLGSVREDGELWSQFLDPSLVTRSNLKGKRKRRAVNKE